MLGHLFIMFDSKHAAYKAFFLFAAAIHGTKALAGAETVKFCCTLFSFTRCCNMDGEGMSVK